jgi:antitoxin YefM
MATVPVTEARAQLSRLIESAAKTHERVEITRNGRRAAVILSAEDFDSIMETLDILSDAELVRDIREAESEPGHLYTLDEVEGSLRSGGRLQT